MLSQLSGSFNEVDPLSESILGSGEPGQLLDPRLAGRLQALIEELASHVLDLSAAEKSLARLWCTLELF